MSKLTARERERPVSRDTESTRQHALRRATRPRQVPGGGSPGVIPQAGTPLSADYWARHIKRNKYKCIKWCIRKSYWYLPPRWCTYPHVPPPQSSVSRPCPHPLLRVGRAGRAVKDCGRFFAILLIVAYLRREGGFYHPPTELLLRSGLLKVEA